MKSFFITGTGTGVGKTLFTGLFARLAIARGLRTALIKPVQTGVRSLEEGDVGAARKLAPGLLPLPDELACPYLLKLEASPHLAASAEGVRIESSKIKSAIERAEREFKPDILLLEGAGGVCVPLEGDFLTSRLVAELGAPAIVVASAGLGTINHAVLTVRELERAGAELAGIAVNRMPAKPGLVELDNLKSIERIAKAKVLCVIGEDPDPALDGGFESCEGLLALLGRN